MACIILPTYNENNNIRLAVEAVRESLPHSEIIVVDDNSPDGTGKTIDILAQEYGIKAIHRPKRLGLGSAVSDGLKAASHEVVAVMDADMSHPAGKLPIMLEHIKKGADIVVGSRMLAGSSVEHWPLHRKMLSDVGTISAKLYTNISDPMSGFFMLNKSVIKDTELRSRGYKILLEILRRGSYKKVVEIPYRFQSREGGRSKLGLYQCMQYVSDWLRLIK